VSIAVVSYVMSGKKGRVSSEMEAKINKAAKELGYQPNLIARSLKSGKTSTLGLIVADISNPFFAHIARIIEDTAKQHGYTVIFGSSDESVEKSQDLIDTFLNRQVDGLIIAPPAGTEAQVKMLQKKKMPFVLIDRYFPDIPTDNIRIDNFGAGYAAADCLLKSGRRSIALISYRSGMEHIKERERGYRQALIDHGVAPQDEWQIKASYQRLESEVREGLARLQPGVGVDAILFSTNSLAIEGLKQLNRMGLRIPDDLGVVSFDESDAFDLFYVPITHIRQSLPDMGMEAVGLLLRHIKDKKHKTEEIVVGSDLVSGASCGAVATKMVG
jgi:LacI family transcriptional regulator